MTAGVLEVLADQRILPVLRLDDASSAEAVADALRRGGIHCVEVTMRTAAALETISRMAALDGFVVAAGTVLTPAGVDAVAGAGARFVVSPGYSEAVATRAAHARLPYVPGVATASEILAATEEGFDVVKLFPARQLGGVAAIAALAAPFPAMRFMPSGGITLDDLPGYLSHPAVPLVAGAWMFPPSAIERGDLASVTELARESVAAISRSPI